MAEETITILKVGTDEAIRNIGDLRNNIRILKEQLSGLEIGTEQYQKTLQTLITNQNALRGAMNATTASMNDVAKAAAGVTKETKKEDGQVQQLATTYNGLVNQLANLKRELRNVDISTTKGMETYKTMAVQVNAVNDKLKEMDALQGNYQRNVGNYTSALNGLNVATAQIVRELPAATVSANTFFLAISNNIPALVDQIANLQAQNKLAVAQGGEAVSILGALGKSLLSWNTLITVGVTLLTLFGGKLVQLVGNLFKTKTALDDTTAALKEMEAAMDTKSIAEQIANYRSLAEMYREIGDNADEKREFIEKYRDEIDKTGVSVRNVADADKLFIDGTADFEKAVQQRAMALAGMELAAEQYKKALEEQNKSSERRSELEGMLPDAEYNARVDKMLYGEDSSQARQSQRILDSIKNQIQNIDDRVAALREAGDKYIEAANEMNKEADKVLNLDDTAGGEGGGDKAVDNTLEYVRRMQDEQIALMEDGYAKQLMVSRLHYEREIEDLKTTLETEENLTEEGRAAINETIRALTEQGEQEQTRIMQEWEQEKRDIYQETLDEIIKDNEAFSRELDRQEAEAQRRIERERQRQQRYREGMNDERLRRVDEDADHALAMNDSNIWLTEGDRQQKEYEIIQEANQKKLELLRQFEQDALDAKNPQLAIQYQQQAADMEVEIARTSAERQKEIYDNLQTAKQQSYQNIISGTTNLLDTLASLYEQDAENSEKSAQQAKNLQIASTVISTISGAVSAYMGAVKAFENTGPGAIAGPVVGAVQAALVLATGMAQIAKIKNTEVNKDSTPSGSVGGISATVSAPTITPQVTQVRNVTSASEEDRLNRMADDQRVYILSSDLEANQNQRRVRVRETSF